MSFSPIAIVGRSCLLPGAHSPAALWDVVTAQRSCVTQAAEGSWRIPAEKVLTTPDQPKPDHAWSDRGGYVRDFSLDCSGFRVPAAEVSGLDPLFQWVLHTGREALIGVRHVDLARAGAVYGILGFPCGEMARFAEHTWLARSGLRQGSAPDPKNRFQSGLPVLLLEQALGLGAGGFALDAACASSLYAIAFACERLHSGQADLMLAGAVNRADDLFIHIGFSALGALSKTGQSRPFHAEADGLVPAEGAGAVALKRLADAERDGDPIFGVISGVGLSNDGRGRGFLVPSEAGQVRAIRRAYERAGLSPSAISLLECHATGTPIGDATELDGLRQVFTPELLQDRREAMPIGSLKSNLGHAITAAGLAGLIKLTEALAHRTLPPSMPVLVPHAALGAGAEFRLLQAAEPWAHGAVADGVRRAGLSAFGFGGNNAHLIVEEYVPPAGRSAAVAETLQGQARDLLVKDTRVAVVGMGVTAAGSANRQAFTAAWFAAAPELSVGADGRPEGRAPELEVDIRAAGLPPSDLRQTLAQQLLLLEAAREALSEVSVLPRESTGVFAGMGTDGEIARYGARWRLGEAERELGGAPSAEWLAAAKAAVVGELGAAGVLGTMPNMPANRINRAFDLQGYSCSVSAEELSGLEALSAAARGLLEGGLDAAVACAVDLCCEPVHRAAAEKLLPASRQLPGDAAVALVLKRLSDAERDGDRVYAVFSGEHAAQSPSASAEVSDNLNGAERFGPDVAGRSLIPLFGHSHAASGLLHFAAAALSVSEGVLPGGVPWLGQRRARVCVSALGGRYFDGELEAAPAALQHQSTAAVRASQARVQPLPRGVSLRQLDRLSRATPRLYVLRGQDKARVLAALERAMGEQPAPSPPAQGGACLVVVAADAATLKVRLARAHAHLTAGAPAGPGVYFREAPVSGELGFVFTSAGAAYPRMGAELLCAMPELAERVSARFSSLPQSLAWAFAEPDPQSGALTPPSPAQRLWGASALSQIHAELTLGVLGLKPQAAIGYSSGESNSLFAFGVWQDLDAMRDEFAAAELFEREIGGTFDAVSRAWGEQATWSVWTVLAPLDRVRECLAAEPRLRLAIIHTASECVIAGDSAACDRVVAKLGAGRCHRLEYNLAVHVPEVEQVREAWLQVHRRAVTPAPNVRFYTAAHAARYTPSAESCAAAIFEQARTTLDFPALIEQAYADGVRIFVEHGPGGACAGWIREILGERSRHAVVVALDRKGQGQGATFNAIAELLAAGVPLEVQPWLASLGSGAQSAASPPSGPTLVLPSHPPRVDWPPMNLTPPRPQSVNSTPTAQIMARAPELPSALEQPREYPRETSALAVQPPNPGVALAATQAARPPEARVQAPALEAPTALVQGAQPVVQRSAGSAVLGASQLGQLAELHGAFLRQQADVHQRFLSLRSSLANAALHGTATRGAESPADSHSPARQPAPAARPAVQEQAALRAPQAPPPQASVQPQRSAPVPSSVQAQRSVQPELGVGVPRVAPHEPDDKPRGNGTPNGGASSRTLSAAPGASGTQKAPRGITLNREQLKVHASGEISQIFGPLFKQQDGYHRQVRMPEPPLLLADRVTGIDAEPGVMGRGSLWTETDVTGGAWYLFRGRMPAGIMIESGQADLMLISYMGADFLNKSERVYRLLGCRLTYFGDLPQVGETLVYDIHVDGHAQHGDVRLFFFHYDCHVNGELRLRVEGGQAGFFTDQELSESAGVVWSPESQAVVPEPRLDPPDVVCARSSFEREEVRAFADGRPFDCFGPGFEGALPHSFTPRIQAAPLLFLDTVPVFDPQGGPWGRGYLRAEAPVSADDWYFAGHFKHDPCMPGTLMFEGCVQALSFYLAAMGFTLKRDGWRFQPSTGEPVEMRCRGQVTPSSRQLTYEVFVEELSAGPEPTVFADVLCSVDGRKAFHARRVGLKLVPDWPLSATPALLAGWEEPKPVASVRTQPARPGEAPGELELGYRSLLACAWGRPTEAFGPMYQQYDGPMPVPRLPGPPYHFMSRVLQVTGAMGEPKPGARVEVEYDVPADAWYFAENGARSMPFCVLLEAALQPCGWLASFVGGALGPTPVVFRNLDGTGTQHLEVFDTCGSLRTEVELTKVSRSAGMTLVGFTVNCFHGDALVYDMDTVFGFFPPNALDNQVGLPVGDAERATLESPSSFKRELSERRGAYYEGSARLPGSKLDMLNRVTGYWPEGGALGLGAIRAEKDVEASDWYFKAHFFQDPVQPGSLGVEAMLQLLQVCMLERGMHRAHPSARFEPIALQAPLSWKYRGQVVPRNRKVTVTLELTEVGEDERGPFALAKSSLWVDGIRIYEATGLGMRLVTTTPPSSPPPAKAGRALQCAFAEAEAQVLHASPGGASAAKAELVSNAPRGGVLRVELDPDSDLWLEDHRPTYGRPALPMMYLVDLLARAAQSYAIAAGQASQVVGLADVQLSGWVDFALEGAGRHRTLETEVKPAGARLLAQVYELGASGARTRVAMASVTLGEYAPAPASMTELSGPKLSNPYTSGALFHGPAFQLLRSGVRTEQGASTKLDVGVTDLPAERQVPRGLLNPALLDAGLHAIPHDRLDLWAPEIGADRVGYPARVLELSVFGPVPIRGQVRCEVRFDGCLLKADLPRFRLQFSTEAGVFLQLTLVEACFPKGRLGSLPALARRAFLRDGVYVAGASLSRVTGAETRLSEAEAQASDWMPGTLECIYGTRDVGRIAVHEHVAARECVHPRLIPHGLPLTRPDVVLSRDGDDVVVADAPPSPERLELASVRAYWGEALGDLGHWLGRDLWEGLIQRFVSRVVVTEPQHFQQVVGRPAIYVANHQVQMESLLITNLLAALSRQPVVTMANAKHEQRWIGWVLRALFSHPGARDPKAIVYFDPARPDSMFEILSTLKPRLARGGCSFFVHAQGTRAQSCQEPTTKLSSLFIDLAAELGLPIVPVRFTGGLPVTPITGKLELPVGYGRQEYWIGRPLSAAELGAMPYAERKRAVLAAINSLGMDPGEERPGPPDLEFSAAVDAWSARFGIDPLRAALLATLERVPSPGPETLALLGGARTGELDAPSSSSGRWLSEFTRDLLGEAGPKPRGT